MRDETGQVGCPECSWEGEVALSHDRTHRYYTHVIVSDGQMFKGTTCSERIRRPTSVFRRIVDSLRALGRGDGGGSA